ncbi:MAG TPA: sugar ABC transporter ATP-binding protein [Terriglobales bacterium]
MTEATQLEISGLKKNFGATVALDGIDLAVRRQEVHALVGENGAGKSTLMNILSALIRPDAGSIVFQGRPYVPADPLAARRTGIAHIHQELSLCPHLSVAENIFLGSEPRRRGLLDRRKLNERAAEMLEEFHHPDITAERLVADLPIAARQIVEICRALAQRASLILMDEPTSSLERADVERLFTVIRRLQGSGVSIIYVSHFLEELREIADRCTVLRDGKTIETGALQEMTDQRLIGAMVGRPVSGLFPPRTDVVTGEYALEVEGLSAPPALRRASFEVRRGEILGIAGLIGSGRTELLRALFGLQNVRAGKISISGQPLSARAAPRSRIGRGVGYLSEDRKREGLALALSVADNITLTHFASCSRLGWIDLKKQYKQARDRAESVQVRGGVGAPVERLSGGNQQKVVLARLLHQDCDVFLLDEPTRGVDVASKAEIHTLIVSLARAGKAVVMVSSYLPELFGVCDRLAVMSRGSLSAVRPIEGWTLETVMQAAIGTAD